MNTAKYFFIRHGQLVEPYDDHLGMDYETLADLSTSKLDPDIRTSSLELFNKQTAGIDFSGVTSIYYNNSGKQSQRSEQSAQLIAEELASRFGEKIVLQGLKELHEVSFDVKELIPKELFEKVGMPSIRTGLYTSMITSGPSESISEAERRIITIHSLVDKRSAGDLIFVSHDFFMRIIEVYIARPNRLQNIRISDLENTSLNYYFGGFVTNHSFRKLERFGNKVI